MKRNNVLKIKIIIKLKRKRGKKIFLNTKQIELLIDFHFDTHNLI